MSYQAFSSKNQFQYLPVCKILVQLLELAALVWSSYFAFQALFSGHVEAAFKAQAELPKETVKFHEGCSPSILAIVKYLLTKFVADDKIATVEANIRDFKQGSMIATDYP